MNEVKLDIEPLGEQKEFELEVEPLEDRIAPSLYAIAW